MDDQNRELQGILDELRREYVDARHPPFRSAPPDQLLLRAFRCISTLADGPDAQTTVKIAGEIIETYQGLGDWWA